MTWNPWKALRIEREYVAELERAVEDAWRDSELRVREAHERFKVETAALQAAHNQLLQRCVDIHNLTPPSVLIVKAPPA